MSIDASQVYRLAADLGKAGFSTARKAAQVVAKTAHDIEATAKSLAPVDTGALKNSIGSDISALHAEIGPTVSYGIYQEFGTSRMAPHPFMGPALEQHTAAFLAAVEQLGDLDL